MPELPPSAWNELPRVLWYCVSCVSGVGNHTRVTPAGFRISTRVDTSKMRHLSAEAPCPKAGGARVGYMMLAEARPVKRRKSRRSMGKLLRSEFRKPLRE